MPDILRGYTFSRSASRYRDTQTGRFVARSRIVDLLEQQVNRAEERLSNIVQGLANGELAPGYAQTLMRDEVRRLALQNAALGAGGWDYLDFQDYGRLGRQLRDTYQRVTRLMEDVQDERATLPQALNRVAGHVLSARFLFFATEREALRRSDRRFEERRVLHARESCGDCINYARMGWQPAGTLPLPGEGAKCGAYCRCSIERREVREETQPLRAERITA